MYSAEQITRRPNPNMTQCAWEVELADRTTPIAVTRIAVGKIEASGVADVDAFVREALADMLNERQFTDEILREQGVPVVTQLV